MTEPIDVTPSHVWTPGSDTGPFPLLAAISGALPSAFGAGEAPSGGSRVLIGGTGEHFLGRPDFRPQVPAEELPEESLRELIGFARSNVEWLAAGPELAALRFKVAGRSNLPEADPPADTR